MRGPLMSLDMLFNLLTMMLQSARPSAPSLRSARLVQYAYQYPLARREFVSLVQKNCLHGGNCPRVTSGKSLAPRLRWAVGLEEVPNRSTFGRLASIRNLSSLVKTQGWAPSSLPNPLKDPKACGRPNVTKSNVCDPDNVLTDDGKDVIEGYLNKFDSHCVVAVVTKMDPAFTATLKDREGKPDLNAAAKYFAMSTHDAWGIGDKERQDGILIFLSITDRVVFISRGKGVESVLHSKVISAITTNMIPFLRKGDYNSAIESCVLEIDGLLKRLTTAEEVIQDAEDGKNYEKAGDSSDGRAKEDPHPFDAKSLSSNMWIPILVVLGALYAYGSRSANPDPRPTLEDSKAELETIYETDDVSCPYCLRKYNDNPGRGRLRLTCGHCYCMQCYSELTKASAAAGTPCTCSICNEDCVVASKPAGSKPNSKKVRGKRTETEDKLSAGSSGGFSGPEQVVVNNNYYSTDLFSWWSWLSGQTPSSGTRTSTAKPESSTRPAPNSEDEKQMKSALVRLRRYQERHKHNVSEKEIASIRKGILQGEDKGKSVVEARRRTLDKKISVRNENLARERMADNNRREEARRSGSSGSSGNSSWGSGGGTSSGGGGASW
jgi:uncharacterized membrane protein YgcG